MFTLWRQFGRYANGAGRRAGKTLGNRVSPKSKPHRTTIPEIRARKGGEPVVCLTAYTAPMARLLDDHVDLLPRDQVPSDFVSLWII